MASLCFAGRSRRLSLAGRSRRLFLTGRSRLIGSRRVSPSQVGVVFLFDSEPLLRRSGSPSLLRRSESSVCFIASLIFTGRNRVVLLPFLISHVALVLRSNLFFPGRSRLFVSRLIFSSQVGVAVFSSQVGLVLLVHGESFPFMSASSSLSSAFPSSSAWRVSF